MQEQRSAMGSFPEALGYDHGSSSSDAVNSPPNRLPDYISLNTNQEGQNVSMWTVAEPGSSSDQDHLNLDHTEPRPDRGWPSLMKSCTEPPSNVLSLGDHGSSSSSYTDPFDLDDRHTSRKRKAVELATGRSSSGVGSSSMFQRPEDGSDPTIPRLGLRIGENPLEAHHNNRELDVSGPRLSPPPENPSSHQTRPVLGAPVFRRHFQPPSTWSRDSTWRPTRSPNLELDSVFDNHVSALSAPAGSDEDPDRQNGDAAGPSSGNSPSYNPRRLSAFLRRSLLSATASEGGGGQNGNLLPIIPPPPSSSSSSASSSQDVGVRPGHHRPPHLRGRLVSEIRNVLDLMRRGDSSRFEDFMMLDQSMFYGMADIHDRHRDMRLDIDNMSYEELLALEERIGNVNTGLAEEVISKHLKQKSYGVKTGQPEPKPCCICQEEYKDGDDLGALECGHEFHHGCIKQWLQNKNLCPVCKSAGFATT